MQAFSSHDIFQTLYQQIMLLELKPGSTLRENALCEQFGVSRTPVRSVLQELRIARQLTQEELADRCELSKGFISQLERDLTSPSIATLVDILQCLGTNLNEFFSDDEEEQVVFGDEDYFEKKDTDLKNTIEWIIPNAQRNMMEPIRLTLAPGGATYPDLPHEGEEFGYVLQGSVKIHVGNKVYKAKKGESFYFTPRAKHYIEASSSSGARLIWVSTPPSF